jgi:hypothetical protein
VLTAGFNIFIGARLRAEADDLLRTRAAAVAATVQTNPDGTLTVRDPRDDTALDTDTWIYQDAALADTRVRQATGPAIEPHRAYIVEQRRWGVTMATIHQRLRDEHGLACSASSLRRWAAANLPEEEVRREQVTLLRPEPAVILTRPLGASGGDSLIKPVNEGCLGWGTLRGSAALLGLLVFLIAYQSYENHRHPIAPLPYPLNRRTNQPQPPTTESGHV